MSGETAAVPAADVAHVYRIDRQGQVRGVPWLAPVMITLRTLDEYEDAQLVRQKVAACFAGTLSTPDAEVEAEELKNWQGATSSPAPSVSCRPARSLIFPAPAAEGYAPYTATQLRRIAAGLGVPYEALTGDLSQVNFSSARMGWQEFGRNIEVWRWQMLMPQGLDRIGVVSKPLLLPATTPPGCPSSGRRRAARSWTRRAKRSRSSTASAGLDQPAGSHPRTRIRPDQVLAEWQEFAKKTTGSA